MDIRKVRNQMAKMSGHVNWLKQQKSAQVAPKVAVIKPAEEKKVEEVVPVPAVVEEPKKETPVEPKVEEPTPAVLPELPQPTPEPAPVKEQPKLYREVEIADMETIQVIELWESGNFLEENRGWIEREILRRARKVSRKVKKNVPDGTCSGENVKAYIAFIRDNA